MTQDLTDSVLRQTVTIASDAIICTDSEQRITFFNDGARSIFGYDSEEVLGKPLAMLLPERFRSIHERHLREFGRAAVAARSMGERREISGVRKGGEEFPAEAAIAHVQTADGLSYSVVLRDVTERRRIEAMNAQLVRDLQTAVSARDDMLGIVSHDLRNPVNAVRMLATAILRVGGDDGISADVLAHATTMRLAADQMDSLIQDLLDVSRIEAGRLLLHPQLATVDDLITTTLATLAPLAQEQGVVLVKNIAERSSAVDVDGDRILQVLSNLVGNGIKYTPRGGRVIVSADLNAEDVRISVTDTGIGIAPDDLPHVFDRFWQSRRKARSGAGLGLTIARGIVRAHGGRIWLDSAPGTGTAVHFTLPLAGAPGSKESAAET